MSGVSSSIKVTSTIETKKANINSIDSPTFAFDEFAQNMLMNLGEVSGTLLWSFSKNGKRIMNQYLANTRSNSVVFLNDLGSFPLNNIFKAIGVGTMALDVVCAGVEGYYAGYSSGQIALKMYLTAGKNYVAYNVTAYVSYAVGTWAGAKLGASLGIYAGPVGMIIGVAAGAIVGYFIDEFGNVFIDWMVE